MSKTLVQYIVIRSDLKKVLKWSTGALIAQACHATTAVTHTFYDDPYTKQYLDDLNNMHKIVLEIPDEDGLKRLQAELTEQDIKYKLWVEQPENIPTCLVVKAYPKENVQRYFRRLKLFCDD